MCNFYIFGLPFAALNSYLKIQYFCFQKDTIFNAEKRDTIAETNLNLF